MYIGEYEINEYIDLVATTHRFSSGANYAATSIKYRVYEDGSDTQIIDDTNMTNFDTITGLYYNRVQLTAALGFEVGKSYVILIQATVDSVTSIDWRSFRVKFPAVNVKQISDDGAAADNLESACDNYSATRGLAGTALPAAAADTAGGLPISDAGGLDIDAKLANTNEITVARMGALTDLIDGGRLDLLVDAILADTNELQTDDYPTSIAAVKADTAAVKAKTDSLNFTVAGDVDCNVHTWKGAAAQNMTGDAYSIVNNVTFGNSALKTLVDALSGATGVSVSKILNTALTETAAGRLAAAFKKLFDVLTPVLTCESVNQNQDNATTAEIKAAMEAAGGSLAAILEDTGTTLDTLVKDIPTNAELATALGDLPTAAEITDAVWDEVLDTAHEVAGSSSVILQAAGTAGDPWSTALPGAYGVGTAGKLLGTTIPSAIDAVDNYVDTEITTLATELAKVPKSDSTVSWNATALAAIQGECTDALNAYDPPTKAELDAAKGAVTVATIGANVITAAAMNADVSAEIADAVCDELLTDHVIPGSVGSGIAAAGSAGDPWSTVLPGTYGAGTAGKKLSDLANSTGTGPEEQVYTVLNGTTGQPEAGVTVIMSTDLNMANIIHKGITDALGKVYFWPDVPVGTTVYLWRFKTGVDFLNPDIEVTA